MKIIKEDITNLKVDAIINAANGYVGCMGAGVAKAIKLKGGQEIENKAKSLCKKYKFNKGTTYYTTSGQLPCKYVIHAVTMNYPGTWSSIEVVKNCLNSIFKRAKELNCSTIAIPGLGTKIGRVSYEEAAKLYVDLIPQLEKIYNIETTICDIEDKFLYYLNQFNKQQ